MSTHSLPDPAEHLFRKAAEDARRLIPIKEERLAELRAEMDMIQSQLLRLQRMASLEDEDTGRTYKMSDVARIGAEEQRPTTEIRNLIALALVKSNAVGPLKVGEIGEAIKAYNGKEFADSTLYGHLGKMKGEGLLTNEASRWGLTSEGMKFALGMDLV